MIRIDVRGSYLEDALPRYPQPFDILLERSELAIGPLTMPLPPSSEDTLQQGATVARICESLRQVNAIINRHVAAEQDGFWRNALFPQFHLAPILHDLLSMPRSSESGDITVRRKECFRLAAILYIVELQARFGVDRTGAATYVDKLELALRCGDMTYSWGVDNPFLCWILVVTATSACIPDAMRRELTNLLSSHVSAPGLHGIGELAAMFPLSLWCDSALGSFSSILQRAELESLV